MSHKFYKKPLGKIRTMKRLLLLLLIILQVSCCNIFEISDINEYGLRGEIKQITEHTFLKNNDLAKKLKNDTVSIKNKYYNTVGKLTKITIRTSFSNEFTSFEYIYNKENRILKEIVKSNDSLNFIVNYKYKDSIIISAISLVEYEDFDWKNESNYEYDKKGNLKRVINRQITYSKETDDTIRNIYEINKYNSRKHITETVMNFQDSIRKNEKFIYKSNCEGLIQKTKFYKNGRLEKITTNEYSFDTKKNWIEMKEYSKNTLRKIVKRTIIYK